MNVNDTEDYVEIRVPRTLWQDRDGRSFVQEDYRVGGEIWRVHKHDPDPFPSSPHAHCIDGSEWLVGCKLHLGTGELFRRWKPLRRRLEPTQFDRLIELIRPKFPGVELPLRA